MATVLIGTGWRQFGCLPTRTAFPPGLPHALLPAMRSAQCGIESMLAPCEGQAGNMMLASGACLAVISCHASFVTSHGTTSA